MNTGTMFNGNHAYNTKQQIRYIYIHTKESVADIHIEQMFE